VTWFQRPKPVSAYSVAFVSEDAAAARFIPQFWIATTRQWHPFEAVTQQTMIDGSTLFQQTERVLTNGVRLIPAPPFRHPEVESVTWYAAVFPYRPIALITTGDSLEEIGSDIRGVEYLLVDGLTNSEMRALRNEFIVIDHFD